MHLSSFTHLPSPPPYVKLPSLSTWDLRKQPPLTDDLQLPPIHLALSPFDAYSESSQDSPYPSPQEEAALSFTSRKGSIASLLNSDPELRMLDEEVQRAGFPSHFHGAQLKRGRPPRLALLQPVSPARVTKRRARKTTLSDAIVSARTPTGTSARTKGLRHFSKQVCDKVRSRGVTTYNEVADELAMDIRAQQVNDKHAYDQKNIRRRVYDALNVLMAIDVIAKDKKKIKWLGIPSCNPRPDTPTSAHDMDDADDDLLEHIRQEELRQAELVSSVERTGGQIRDSMNKYMHLRLLIERNLADPRPCTEKTFLPFALVTGQQQHDDDTQNRDATVTASHDRSTHTVYQDIDVLRRVQSLPSSPRQLAALLPDPSLQEWLAPDSNDTLYTPLC